MLISIKCNVQLVLNQLFTVKTTILFVLVIIVTSCGPSKLKTTDSPAHLLNGSEFSDTYFKGLLVIDPEKGDTLVNINSKKYFTPASNTKIFTLYSGITLLPKQIPSLKYLNQDDTLILQGTGDPTWLHPFFKDSSAIDFLKNHKNIALHLDNYDGGRYQPGWAWEDFDTYFSPELGPIPLYGNVITVTQNDSLMVTPKLFLEHTYRGTEKKRRDERSNRFFIPYTLDTLQIPFITSKELTKQVLGDLLQRDIKVIDSFPDGDRSTYFGMASDSIFKRMMHESDNFLAEQIMLMASSQISDTLSFNRAKNEVLEKHLKDLNHPPRWVDGSGLSRYNLFTPESMVAVLHKLFSEIPRNRLFQLFPYWDESGTLKNPGESSFIIAKSGALGNNYNLSGYLIAKSGKIFIFSCMNNHFRIPTSAVRKEIKQTLQAIHESY